MQNKKIKPPRFAEWLLYFFLGNENTSHRMDDFEEVFLDMAESSGLFHAQKWYWKQVLISLPNLIINSVFWSITMFKNYLTTAFRNIARYKMFSFINIFGLALGISACVMIYLWVQKELSYDDFHKKADRIYRVERELFRDNLYSRWPICSGAYKQALIDDYPEIENAVRFWKREFSIKDHKGFVHRQAAFAVDNSMFDIFDFNLREGDEGSALIEPMTAVLTLNQAFKFFGTYDVVGKSLTLEWDNKPTDFKITGVLNEVPENSHIDFSMLISISSYPVERFTDWRSNYLYTYVLTTKGVKRSDLEEKLATFVSSRLEPVYDDLLGQGLGIHEVLKIHLFPITDIHLYPSPNWEIGSAGSMTSVIMFSSIAILILFIACINFINLSTARASKRAKEVGLRKTIGAYVNQLRKQFILESLLLAVIAFCLALVLISLFVPALNNLFNEKISFFSVFQLKNVAMLLGITITVGFFAGLYPAFYLTKFEPGDILKNNLPVGRRKSIFRRNMVVIQFIISTTLIIGTLIVYQQTSYIQNKSLGFDKENVILIPTRSQQVVNGYENFRNELLNNPQILSLAVSSDLPGEALYSNTNFRANDKTSEPVSLIIVGTDHDFIQTYHIDLVAGRSFSREYSSDTSGTIILNQAAVQKFGWNAQEAIGKELDYYMSGSGKIVGVVKDFNFRTLHTKIEPMALLLYPKYFDAISVRIKPGNFEKTKAFIQQKWAAIFPDELFEFNFLDQRMDQLYEIEMKMKNIFIIFSCFSIFVACLGLVGLSASMAEEKTKEIGIRKVLGASTIKILSLLINKFVIWIIISTVVAFPIAYFIMNKWLQNFAYRIDIEWRVFIFTGLITLIISLLTVSSQTIKAAFANPISSIKYE